MENLDCTNVVIVGGGIAGLYTAWRLATSTPYVVTVLEYSSRFGGRYHTCKMPGGFPADLGAMRYFPLTQPTLHCLIQKMDLPIEKLFMNSTGKENTAKSYLRNVHVRYDVNDLQHLYAFTDDEKKLFGAARVKDNVKESDDGDFQKARFTGTGCLAKDVCMAEYFSHYLNSGVLEGSLPNYPSSCTLAEVNGYKRQFQEEDDKRELAGYHCVKGGMERIVIALRKELSKFQNVKLLNNHPVTRVEENGKSFIVRGDNCGKDFSIPCDKIILACNARGIELITWISPFNRVTHLQTQLSKINWTNSIKLFLTYRTPWWQDHGLVTGQIFTDLPIGSVVAFGDRGTNGEYSTLLACFTYKFIDIFQGLNQDHAERFENTIGEVEEGLVPSKRLVDYVERQLIKVFDRKEIEPPVCACVRIWKGDPITACSYESQVGVNHNRLYWQNIKPFSDSEVYITGDTFVAYTKEAAYMGWSESALLTSERMLFNYFGLSPISENLSLKNDWPESLLCKL